MVCWHSMVGDTHWIWSVPNANVILSLRKLFFKVLEDISPFCGAIDTPVWDLWWQFLWISKPEWAALFALGGGIDLHFTHFLRFTSGMTLADRLKASMAAELISSTYLKPVIGGAQTGGLPCHGQGLQRPSYFCEVVRWPWNCYILTIF